MFTPKRSSRLRKIAALLSVTAATALVVGSTTGATAMAEGDPEGMAVTEVVDDSAPETAVDEPAAEEPSAEEPSADESIADESIADETAADQPAADEPVTDQPATDRPATDEPTADLFSSGAAPLADATQTIALKADHKGSSNDVFKKECKITPPEGQDLWHFVVPDNTLFTIEKIVASFDPEVNLVSVDLGSGSGRPNQVDIYTKAVAGPTKLVDATAIVSPGLNSGEAAPPLNLSHVCPGNDPQPPAPAPPIDEKATPAPPVDDEKATPAPPVDNDTTPTAPPNNETAIEPPTATAIEPTTTTGQVAEPGPAPETSTPSGVAAADGELPVTGGAAWAIGVVAAILMAAGVTFNRISRWDKSAAS